MAIWCATATRFPTAGVRELAVGKVVKGKQQISSIDPERKALITYKREV